MNATAAGGDSGRYTRTQVILHWSVALLVTVQLFFNDAIEDDAGAALDTGGFVSPSPLGWAHIVVGTIILALALWRLGLRLSVGAPEAAMPAPRAAIWAAKAAHLSLYGFLLFVPVSGALAFFGRSGLAAELHELLVWLLVPLILAHMVAALVEHAVFGNATLTRMLELSPVDDADTDAARDD